MKVRFDVKIIGAIAITALISVIAFNMLVGMTKFAENAENGETGRITEVIRHAAVQCYALEGSYPPSIDYLAEKYELILDREKYIYYYDMQMSNIMPEIIVLYKHQK